MTFLDSKKKRNKERNSFRPSYWLPLFFYLNLRFTSSSLLEIKDKFCFHFSISTWIIFLSKETKSAIHFGLPIGCLFFFTWTFALTTGVGFRFKKKPQVAQIRWHLFRVTFNLLYLKSKTSFASIFQSRLGLFFHQKKQRAQFISAFPLAASFFFLFVAFFFALTTGEGFRY